MTNLMKRNRGGYWVLRYVVDRGPGFLRWIDSETRTHVCRTKFEGKAFLVALRMRGVNVQSHEFIYQTYNVRRDKKELLEGSIRSVKQARQERRFK